jgi:hypothetical protein
MSEKNPLARRAAQVAAFTVGGGIALTSALAGSASADEVTVQDAEVTNAGVGVANSGGNVALGNASQNSATCAQGALGVVASNSCEASTTSDGTASVETGDATGVGNQSATGVHQHAASGDGAGLALIVQDADVTNVGVGMANSGGNLAVGNASQNLAVNLQGAFGVLASNSASVANASNGSASVKTGKATGIGNRSATDISQGTDVDPDGLAVVLQSAPVLNAGFGAADSGLNAVVANGSLNAAIVAQVSFGLLASNVADVGSWSDGFAMVLTGDAAGIGNQSATKVDQDA